MSAPWPPPPDLESLKELFATADVEGLIADGCPLDEYDPEAKHFFDETLGWTTSKFVIENLEPLLMELFSKQFTWSDAQKTERKSGIASLATQIERFFGPEAQPQVRTS